MPAQVICDVLQDGSFRAVGAPTEAALLVLAEKLGVSQTAAQQEILRLRRSDPDSYPCGACEHYASKWVCNVRLLMNQPQHIPACVFI